MYWLFGSSGVRSTTRLEPAGATFQVIQPPTYFVVRQGTGGDLCLKAKAAVTET